MERQRLQQAYIAQCDPEIQAFYKEGRLLEGVRWLGKAEVAALPDRLAGMADDYTTLRHSRTQPLYFVQYGTGCPIMDVIHIKIGEAWGADGMLHFDPSWALSEKVCWTACSVHQHDGTIVTLDNLRLIHQYMNPATLWNVRGHRGLNTPELQVLGHAAGADLLRD